MELYTVLLAVACLVLFIIYYWVIYCKFRRCNIPGPTPYPLFGNMIDIVRFGRICMAKEWQKKYGRVYGTYFGQGGSINVTDREVLRNVFVRDFAVFQDRGIARSLLPSLVQNGVFFMEGKEWRRTRNIMTPAFSAGKLKKMVGEINRCAHTLTSNFLEQADTGNPIDVKSFFGAYTMDVIASTAFGLHVDSQKSPEEPFVKHASSLFSFSGGILRRIPFFISAIFPTFGYVVRFLGLSFWKPDTVAFFENTGHALVEDRKKNPMGQVDFLQLLLNVESDEGDTDNAEGKSADTSTTKSSIRRLTTDEIVSQAFVFFIAGYETTGSALRYAAYRLALHPDIDEKLYAEIQEHVGDTDPDYEGLANLKYLDCFVNEVLRFYPPLAVNTRCITKDMTYNGMVFPKGCNVQFDSYHIQHDPDYYPNPEEFDPDRFLPENKDNIDPVTFLPFGYGPRHCLGMRLALAELKLALVQILKKMRFVKCPETEVPLQLQLRGLLIPVKPIKVAVERRL